MAYLEMNKSKLEKNFNFLNNLFKSRDIKWSIVTKVLCGDKTFLKEILDLGVTQICDSRLSNLKTIKAMNPDIETIYIKPPSSRNISNIVKYADISVNTELFTIKALSKAAKKAKRVHKVIIMIEMGELREGVMREEFIKFYEKVFKLDNIEIVGIGANFTCLYGILPNQDKLIQLSLYEQLIEALFKRQIPYLSGGSSVVIPLLLNETLPLGINHFRVGETLFLGTNVYNDQLIDGMEHSIFKLYAEIIELTEKPVVPSGQFGTNVEGKSYDFNNEDIGKQTYRAIIDLGLLDVDEKHVWFSDKGNKFVGASSDMIVVDIKDNPHNKKVGDLIEFDMDYMGLLRLMNSKYIEKKVIE